MVTCLSYCRVTNRKWNSFCPFSTFPSLCSIYSILPNSAIWCSKTAQKSSFCILVQWSDVPRLVAYCLHKMLSVHNMRIMHTNNLAVSLIHAEVVISRAVSQMWRISCQRLMQRREQKTAAEGVPPLTLRHDAELQVCLDFLIPNFLQRNENVRRTKSCKLESKGWQRGKASTTFYFVTSVPLVTTMVYTVCHTARDAMSSFLLWTWTWQLGKVCWPARQFRRSLATPT